MNFWMGKAGGVTLMGTCVEGRPSSEHVQQLCPQWTWQPCRRVGRQATSTPNQGEVDKGLSAEWLRGLSAPGWSQAAALEVLSCLLRGKVQGPGLQVETTVHRKGA